jgi:hypothetical protein
LDFFYLFFIKLKGRLFIRIERVGKTFNTMFIDGGHCV